MTEKKEIGRILTEDLPTQLLKEVNIHIKLFSVTLVIFDNDPSDGTPCMGTLVNFNGKKGIVTVRHVWDNVNSGLENRNYLGITINPNGGIYRIKKDFLTIHRPKDELKSLNFEDLMVPDILFIEIPDYFVGTIKGSHKIFYPINITDINSRLERMNLNEGFWISCGCPNKLFDKEKKIIPHMLYRTESKRTLQDDKWDLIELIFNHDGSIPQNLGGLSGGGIWNVKFQIDVDEKRRTKGFFLDKDSDIVFMGVNVYQTPVNNNFSTVIGHGPKSVYRNLFQICS